MSGKPKKNAREFVRVKRPRRTRQRFLKSLTGGDFDTSRAMLPWPGHVVVGAHGPRETNLRLVVLDRTRKRLIGYEGHGKTPMEALRDAAWNWLDDRKGVPMVAI